MSLISFLLAPDVILVCLVAFLIALYIFRKGDPPNLPPGPPGVPILGNIWKVSHHKKLGLLFRDWAKVYGPVFRIKLGPRIAVVLNGYDTIKEALVDKADYFSSRPYMPNLHRANRHSGILFTSHWKERRRLALTSMRDFGLGKKSLEERIREEAGILVEKLKESSLPDLHNLFPVVTTNIICTIIRGERFEYGAPVMKQIVKSFQELINTNLFRSFGDFLEWTRFLPQSVETGESSPTKLTNEIIVHIKGWVEEHKNTFDEDNIRDLIDLFIAESKNPDGILKEHNILHFVVDLFAAGTETTSTTLLWSIAFLMIHKDIQAKCRKEIVDVIGTGRSAEYNDSKACVYINAFLLETERIVNILPLSLLHATGDTATLHGYTIPKDVIVIVNLESALKDEKYFPDPFTFRPERWIDSDGRLIKMHAHIPFSTGKRICLGEQLAKKELFIFLCTLIQNFEFSLSDPDNPPNVNKSYGRLRSAPTYQAKLTKI